MEKTNQIEFASILYDSMFGLILFFSLDSFLDIQDPMHLLFYFFTNIIVIHWWLLFRAAADTFRETRRSALFIFFNILYIIFLEIMVLHAKTFDVVMSTMFLLSIFLIDIFWIGLIKYFHEWKTHNTNELRSIKNELKNILKSDMFIIFPLIVLLSLSALLSTTAFVIAFLLIYIFYMILSFTMKIIDLKFV